MGQKPDKAADKQDSRHLGDPGTTDFQVERYPFYLLNRTVGRCERASSSGYSMKA